MTTTKKTKHQQKLPLSNNKSFDKELQKAMKQYDKLLKVLIDK